MTDPADRLPDDYQERIQALESDLGRSVCGFPTEGLEPCEQWPADESEHCSRHKDRDLDQALDELTASTGGSSQSLTPQETLREPQTLDSDTSREAPSSWYRQFDGSYFYWTLLVLVGLLIGAGTAAVTFNGSPPTTQDETSAEPGFELNFDDPDFTKLRESYRQGNYEEVARSLEELIEETNRDSVKAQGLYYSFVFHQNQQDYRRALEDAERFLEENEDHYRRAEVLYGAWFISNQFLEDAERAEQYRETLLEEFPDSKWANRLSS